METRDFIDNPITIYKKLGFFEKNIQYFGKYFPQSSWISKKILEKFNKQFFFR